MLAIFQNLTGCLAAGCGPAQSRAGLGVLMLVLVSFLDAFDDLSDDRLAYSGREAAGGLCLVAGLALRGPELLVFSGDLVDIGVPLAAVEPDGGLLAGRDCFADGEDLGRDLLGWVELPLRRADPFGSEVRSPDGRVAKKARGADASAGNGLGEPDLVNGGE